MFSALGARFSGVLLQVVSLPIAAAALGTQGFAIYAMLVAIMSWLTLSNLGIGPALTVLLSRQRGMGDTAAMRTTFGTGVWLMGAITSGVSLVAALALAVSPVADLVFGSYPDHHGEILASLGLAIAFFFVTTNLNSIEATQLAFQQQYQLNMFVGAGTLVAAIAVFASAKLLPLPSVILVASQLPLLVARIANSVLFLTAHREITPWPPVVDGQLAGSLCKSGLQFSSAGMLNNFLCHVFPLLVIGAVSAPNETATFAAVVNAVIIAASFFSVFSIPLLSAVPDAYARGDISWIRKAYRRMLMLNLCYATAIFVVLALIGEWLFRIWYQGTVSPDRAMLSAAGFYLVMLGLESVNFTFLAGLGQISRNSFWMMSKAVLAAALIAATASMNASVLPIVLLIVTSVALSAIPLTALVVKQFRMAMA